MMRRILLAVSMTVALVTSSTASELAANDAIAGKNTTIDKRGAAPAAGATEPSSEKPKPRQPRVMLAGYTSSSMRTG